LRLAGKSYGEILKELDIPSKGTLSRWFRDLRLPDSSARKLAANIKRATEKGLLEFNQERSKRIAGENEAAQKNGRTLVGDLSHRELMLIGAALYWGEGAKMMPKGRHPTLDFANSDPKMVAVYMRFLREVLQVEEDRIRAGIHLYAGTDVAKAKQHWSNVTGLPRNRFFIVKQVSRASKGKRAWNRLPFGTISIRTSNRKLFYHVIGILEGISEAVRDVSGYGIHGTIEPDSIGQQASMGCVRLHRDDVEIIYEVLTEGASTVRIQD